MEADVFLEVTAELVTGQVITEAEALSRDKYIHLLSDRAGKQRLKTLCTHRDRKSSVCIRVKTIYTHTHSVIYLVSVTITTIIVDILGNKKMSCGNSKYV